MKLWRNSEGREFPACSNNVEICGVIEGCYITPAGMRNLGYELVDAEPAEEFEVVAASSHTSESTGVYYLASDRLIPGKTYLVKEKR